MLAVTRSDEPDDAIRIANDTNYGLVWINGWDGCDITMPFGGALYLCRT